MTREWLLPAAVFLGAGVFVLTGQPVAAPAVFTAAQAEAGKLAYENTCGKCHTPALTGRKGEPGETPPLSSLSAEYQQFIGPRGWVPPLVGSFFIERWGSRTAAQLISRFEETVPYFPPAGLNDETTVNLTAYILQMNGARAGLEPLTRRTGVVVRAITR